MKHPLALAAALFVIPVAPAQEQIVTLGDSLTFAYQAEFGFNITIPFVGSFGDGFDEDVLNWIEILSDPAYRNDHFDQGGVNNVNVALIFNLFLRRDYNWAIPGIKIDDLRRYLSGEVTITELLAESDNFAELNDLLGLSNFSDADFALAELEGQLANTAERVVLFVGGNDVNSIYGPTYTSNNPGTFVQDFVEDATWIVDWVLSHNPEVEMVLANVPHVGITPLVKATYPTDPVGTGNVTAVLNDLNNQLAALAASRGIGYADVYRCTLPLLDSDPLCIHGIGFQNSGSTTGDLDFVWLNGPISDNFHPNTNAQTLIANEIVTAFNRRYDTGIAPLSASEILGGLLQKTPSEIDMPFATWIDCFGLTGASVTDDSDRDGLQAGLEFALGLNPAAHDSSAVSSGLVEEGGTTFLELAYPTRLVSSSRYTLTPVSSNDLSFAPLLPAPAPDADGLTRARIPVTAGQGFLQLQVEVGP